MIGGRTENQDDLGYAETPLGVLLIVCDGMGGGPGGKTASYIVKTTIIETLCNSSAMASPADVFKMAVSKANDTLEEKMAQVPDLKGMGSTMVAILINEKQATIVHLGDSRCYRLKNNKLVFRTKDHSLVGELVQNGALTEEQARTSPQSNVITRGLGSTTNHVAEIDEVPYQRGDRFVLCTDGVWGIMPHDDLMMRLTSQQSISTLVKDLSAEIDKIGESHGNHHDNHTLAIIELKNDSIKKDPMKKPAKILLYAGVLALIVSVIFNVVSFLRFGANPQLEALRFKTDSLAEANEQLEQALIDAKIKYDSYHSTYQERLNELMDNSNDVSKKERAEALKREQALQDEIDSLRVVIDRLSRSQAQQPMTKQSTSHAKDVTAMSNLELVDYLIAQFGFFRDAKAKDENTVHTAHAVFMKEIEKALAQLNSNTREYSANISKIEKWMKNTPKAFDSKWNVWPPERGKNEYYTSPEAAKRIDGNIIPELQKIRADIQKKMQ